MGLDRAVFLRIDTVNGASYLSGPCGEIVANSVMSGNTKSSYDLLGFVVLPNELQLLIVPHGKGMNEIFNMLQAEVGEQLKPLVALETGVFDPDFYREKIDCIEEIRLRLRWMHSAPIRSKLTASITGYPYSSANERYRTQIPLSSAIN